MELASDSAISFGRARRLILQLILFTLISSTVSAISPQLASAATEGSGNCVQTYSISTGSGSVSVTESSGYCYVAFKNSGASNTQTTFSWTRPSWLTSLDNVLIVAGGGGGGAHVGAGGGAGGLRQLSNENISSLSNISLTVGAGGAGAFTISGGDVNQGSTGSYSQYGQNSSFNGVTSTGGGRGAFWWNDKAGSTGDGLAGNGGSGGGAVNQTSANTPGATGTTGQGNSGGGAGTGAPGANFFITGGGGGASTAGGTASHSGTIKSGDGGAGSEISWLNSVSQTLNVGHWVSAQSKTYFSGGGGGGFHTANATDVSGLGGVGGGGKGAGPSGSNQVVLGGAGMATTGGGGGGSGAPSSGSNRSTGGAGGSGIVVFRYLAAPSNSAAPTISGTTTFGQTLTSTTGTWANSPTSYSYQWSRADSSGGSYSNISGATSSTYNLVTADVGKYLKSTVTATNDGGSASSTSTATSQIAKANQTNITITSSSSTSFGSNLELTSSGGSTGGTFTYTVISGSCTIEGSTLTPTSSGTCVIRSSLAENDNYLAAQSVETTITISTTSVSATITLEPGALTYRQAKSVSASSSVAGKVTFKVNGKVIPRCKKKVVAASATVICSYRPSTRGYVVITATLNPTDPSYIGTTTTTSRYFVGNRSGRRAG